MAPPTPPASCLAEFHAGPRTRSGPTRLPWGASGRPSRFLAPLGVAFLPVLVHAGRRTDAVDRRRARKGGGLFEAERHFTRFALADGIEQQPAVQDDALVRGGEVFLRAVGDAPRRLAGPLIVDVDVEAHAGEGTGRLLLRAEAPGVFPRENRLVVRCRVSLETLGAHRLLVHRATEAGEDGVP